MTEPVPTSHNGKIDPSKLTTDAVRAAVEESRRDLVASEKLAAGQIKRIEDVNKERFHSIANEFQLVERGRIEQKADTKQAVDAALIAQKEAVKEQTVASEKAIDKSEKTTAEQIKALSAATDQSIKAVIDSVGELKDRVGAIESAERGRTEQRNEHRAGSTQSTNLLVGLGLVIVGALALIAPHIH